MTTRKDSRPPPALAPDQQPIQRVVGRRVSPPLGQLPSKAARDAMSANARYLTRAPKGVFIYDSHDEMTRDRERWTTDAVLERAIEALKRSEG